MNEYQFELRVYLEDTDAQGIVYHANYVKFFERARTELFEQLGVQPPEQAGRLRFVVHEMNIKFLRPAMVGERLRVVTTFRPASEYRLSFTQKVHRGDEPRPLTEAEVQVVCIDEAGQLVEVPEKLLAGA